MNEAYYDAISEGYEELHGEEQRKKIDIIMPHLKIKKRMVLLDVGCGTGMLFDCVDLNIKNKIGIDPAKELIRIAEKKKNGTYLVGCAEALPFKEQEFDIVMSLTAIQNFCDLKKGLEEMKRVGKKENGQFVLTFLKKSAKKDRIEQSIKEIFKIKGRIEEERDIIYLCE